MDRLELYYSAPHQSQPLGDYIRIRNVFVRSTRSFRRLAGETTPSASHCRELELMDKLRRLRAFEGRAIRGGGAVTAAGGHTPHADQSGGGLRASIRAQDIAKKTPDYLNGGGDALNHGGARKSHSQPLLGQKSYRKLLPWLVALIMSTVCLCSLAIQIGGLSGKSTPSAQHGGRLPNPRPVHRGL